MIRDDFPRVHYLRSNTLPKMVYSTFGSEILRTVRITYSKLVFLNNSKKLIAKVFKQGGRIIPFSHTLAKVYGRHFQTPQKFFPTFSNFIE